ncbi:hypothetical protein IAR55_005803 [Kwoniella newhampshirensis]|uniref:RNA helicase n=1 Tax=Kwoniella newhampshirensis TaxID=1651941 RepID=A0AAW0YUY8_9TREE
MDLSAVMPSWAVDSSKDASGTPKATGPGGQWRALNVEPDLVRSLLLRKFKSPTPIQRASIPGALSLPPRDILGMARTGSGKTLAYLIPLLQRLGSKHVSSSGPRSLILCPSRELAVQIYTVGKDLARGMGKGKGKEGEGLRWAVVIGGDSLDGQFEKMSSNPDILFEMGFDSQLREILHRLPPTRQNLLFSATLPSTVAEFAKAGLANPLLVRLDADHKISPDLDLRFLSVKPNEKEASLLSLLRALINSTEDSQDSGSQSQAIVFVSTKHHVDYIAELLRNTGYRTSHIYSSLDQAARQQQLSSFRAHSTDVLVVTDVAARGLDIPVMDHVINYDFPAGPRIFVHRVGRTARAGRKGTAWSMITREDWPYLCDLQTFLGPSRLGDCVDVLKVIPSDLVSENVEYIFSSLQESAPHLGSLRNVMMKGQAMYERSRAKANPLAYRQAKGLSRAYAANSIPADPLFGNVGETSVTEDRARLLESVATYSPHETVFEVGHRGESAGALLMKNRRKLVETKTRATKAKSAATDHGRSHSEVALTPTVSKSYKDTAFYMDHSQRGADSDKAYSLNNGTAIPEALSAVALDLTADEGGGLKAQKASQLSWDRKKKKFIKKSGDPEGQRMIRSESGALLPASYNSGRYVEWKSRRRGAISLGEGDNSTAPSKPKGSRSRQLSDLRITAQDQGVRKNARKMPTLRSAQAVHRARQLKTQRSEKTGRHARRK